MNRAVSIFDSSFETTKSLLDAFEETEINKLGAGTHERLHRLMEKLYAEIFSRP